MLWSCQETQSLIREFSRWLRIKNINLTFTEELFIFNIGNTYSTADLHIFIIIKNYIFISKRQNQRLSMTALKIELTTFSGLDNIQLQRTMICINLNTNGKNTRKSYNQYIEQVNTYIICTPDFLTSITITNKTAINS